MSKRTSERVVRNVAKLLVCAVVDQTDRAWFLHPTDFERVARHAQTLCLRVVDLHDRRREDAQEALSALAMLPPVPTVMLTDEWRRVVQRATKIFFRSRDTYGPDIGRMLTQQSIHYFEFGRSDHVDQTAPHAKFRAYVQATLGAS